MIRIARYPVGVSLALAALWCVTGLGIGPAGLSPDPGREEKSPELTARSGLRLMWYNTENLFYPADDTLEADDGFTPGGIYHWSWERYREKLTRVARVIVAAGQWEPPDLVGLAEVENGMVLEDLVSHPILAPYHYSYLHRDSPDHRGMDVACLVRDGRFRITGWRVIPPVGSGDLARTREFLHVTGTWGRRDTLDLLLAHLISRYRGTGATAGYRREQATRLAALADSICRIRRGGLLVMAGDFNEPWGGYGLEPLSIPGPAGDSITCFPRGDQEPSYKFRGRWSGIDLFLVPGLAGRYRVEGSVIRHPAMLADDTRYGGSMPFRTYEGFRYTGGFSDHLPIILDISRPIFPNAP